MATLTAARVRELLNYNPETGEFIWLISPNGTVPVGSQAGSVSIKRYRHITIDRKCYSAHRLAWLYYYGGWPNGWIDHINHNRFDNRICNLREATPAQSAQNRSGHKGRKCKSKGVYSRLGGRRFESWIMRSGRHHYLGRFTTEQAAASAYAEAAARLHGEFAFKGGSH